MADDSVLRQIYRKLTGGDDGMAEETDVEGDVTVRVVDEDGNEKVNFTKDIQGGEQ